MIRKLRGEIGFALVRLGRFIMTQDQSMMFGRGIYEAWATHIDGKDFRQFTMIEGGSNEKH
jgi:putative SOS response-associated peptidase YedK